MAVVTGSCHNLAWVEEERIDAVVLLHLYPLCSWCTARGLEKPRSLRVHPQEDILTMLLSSPLFFFIFTPPFVSATIFLPFHDLLSPSPSLAVVLLPGGSVKQTSAVQRATTDNVNHAACDWQLGEMAVAAHRGMKNPFSGCTRVGLCTHLSAENRGTDYQSQLTLVCCTRVGVERLKATQISMKINRWRSVNHPLLLVFNSPLLFICSSLS